MGLLARVRHFLFRSAETGRFVSKEYAEKHPDTSVRERSDR